MDNNNPQLERIYHQLNRLEESVECILPDISAMKTDLKYHIKRSDLLEMQVKIIEKNYQKFYGFFSIGGWIIGIAGAIVTMVSVIGVFGK